MFLMLIFSIQAFLVDVYGRGEGKRETDLPDHVGMCYIHSDTLSNTEGQVEATITSMKHQPIGRLVGKLYFDLIPSSEKNSSCI